MKKVFAIMIITIVSLLIVGCSAKQAEVKTSGANTQVSVQNGAVDVKVTQGINDASTTSNTLDTTQVDVQLGSANKSLASW